MSNSIALAAMMDYVFFKETGFGMRKLDEQESKALERTFKKTLSDKPTKIRKPK